MANESEYDDIRDMEDLSFLAGAFKEARGLAHEIHMEKSLSPRIRKIAFNIELEAEQSLGFFSTLERKPLDSQEVWAKYKRRSTGKITKGVIQFAKAVQKDPKYHSAEFKCLDDFDKCRRHRGNCHLVFFICIGKRIIPLVRQK
jgi:hypothetical protein